MSATLHPQSNSGNSAHEGSFILAEHSGRSGELRQSQPARWPLNRLATITRRNGSGLKREMGANSPKGLTQDKKYLRQADTNKTNQGKWCFEEEGIRRIKLNKKKAKVERQGMLKSCELNAHDGQIERSSKRKPGGKTPRLQSSKKAPKGKATNKGEVGGTVRKPQRNQSKPLRRGHLRAKTRVTRRSRRGKIRG